MLLGEQVCLQELFEGVELQGGPGGGPRWEDDIRQLGRFPGVDAVERTEGHNSLTESQ